jgi:hypothetical protein
VFEFAIATRVETEPRVKVSAYIILHQDLDFLAHAIKSIYDHADEIVVVDGAYEWIAPFLAQAGEDPEKSAPALFDILEPFSAKIRYFSGLWRDELHKRSFGFAQCTGDVIIRFDADEIFEIDEAEFERFLKSDKSFGQMVWPLVVAPGFEKRRLGASAPRQSAFFKAEHFPSPQDHCSYLLLVLTSAERALLSVPRWSALYAPPIARVAHLTNLRCPDTAMARARYYQLLYCREQKILPWGERIETDDVGQIAEMMLSKLGLEDYLSWLKGHVIVSGFTPMENCTLHPLETSSALDRIIKKVYDVYTQQLESIAISAAKPRVFLSGHQSRVNISGIAGVTKILLRFDAPIRSAHALIEALAPSGATTTPAATHTDGTTIEIDLSAAPTQWLRACLNLSVSYNGGRWKGRALEMHPI